MRRVPALLLICLSFALCGAGKSTPAPAPAPAATPAASRALPMVVIYPFQTSSDIKAGVGQNAAQVFVQQINTDGGLDAVRAPEGVKRDDYLSYARKLNADYYVSGYMTPLGNGVSLVEQVVSTRSGTIVYGQTAQINSFLDATAQATLVHNGIMSLEQQMADAYQNAQAQATAPPASAGNNQANISKGIAGLAGLFKHKAAAAAAAPVAKPSKGVLVARVNGALPASDLNLATTELYNALSSHYNARLTTAAGTNLAKTATTVCGSDRDNTVATGTASATTTRRGLFTHTQYRFVLDVYACFGALLGHSTGTGGSMAGAITSAVDAYAKAHPNNG